MYNDSPEDVANDLLLSKAWAGNSLCYPVLGTKETLSSFTRKGLLEYYNQLYQPQNAVLAVVGHCDKDTALEMAQKYFGSWQGDSTTAPAQEAPAFHTGTTIVEKDIEQTHICIGYNGFERGHPLHHSLAVVNTILGGNMSSRLFQKVREELGLAYSVYSYQSTYSKGGILTLYAGMNPSLLDKTEAVLLSEVDKLLASGIPDDEIARTKHQLKCSLAMALEDASSRVNNYGRSLLLTNEIKSIEQLRATIDAITPATVRNAIEQVFTQPCIAIVKGK